MKGKVLALLLIALFSVANTLDIPEEEGVLVLGDDNFNDAIKTYEYVLVEFYAPWCGHCKKLAPEYARAAQTLKSENLYLAKVDATQGENKALAGRFKVEGFPTLKLFVNGEPQDYNGGRTESEIVNWMRKKTGPATKTLTTVEEVEKLTGSSEVVVVEFSDAASDVFSRIAKSNDELTFASCGSQECLSKWGAQKGTIVLFKKFDEGRVDFNGTPSVEAVTSWITANASPLTMSFDEKCAQIIFGKNTPGLFLYRDKNSEKTAELDAMLKRIAPKIKGKLQVVITDIKEGLETRLAEYVGIESKDLPSVRIHDTRSDLKKYNMVGDITEENIMKFVNDWESGKLKPHLKTEEEPATQDEAVVVLVGKSFERIVMDPTKDVLVEFYAPWCGHCKKLAPIYEEVAKNLAHNKNLVIAKMDSTANEVDGVSVQGFPTIKYWPANNKSSPMDFNEERTVEGFTKFLQKHATAGTIDASAGTIDAPPTEPYIEDL
jgi:protein disulfide-isomerase A1